MKICLNIFVLIFLFVSTAFTQWVQTSGPGSQVKKFLSSNSNIYAGTLSGIFISMTNGDNWTPIGLATERISSIVQIGTGLFAGTYDNGIFFSSDNGTSWEQRNNGITNSNIRCLCSNTSEIFAGTFGGGIFHTTNNGVSWSNLSVDPSLFFVSDIVSNGSNLYAAAISGLFKTSDNGVTWNNIGFNDPIFRLLIHETDIFVPVGNAILNNTTLFVSHDEGGNWEPILTLNDVISDITGVGFQLYFSTINGHGVYNSSNNGLTWTQINEGFNIIPIIDCLGIHHNFIFAGSINAWKRSLELPLPVELSSFHSTIFENNVLLKWTTISETNNSGFEIQRAKSETQVPILWVKIGFVNGSGTSNSSHNYELTDKNVRAGRYIYRLKQIDYDGNFEYHYLSGEVEIFLPQQNNLSQNYPNPFNPNTVVNFDLKYSGFVKINIYSTDGKQILSLVNKMIDQGSYSLNIDGNGLSSGLYFYSLNVDGMDVQVKRMILLK
jgi:photosystem II stability/assembly factor-like uncharacterized protein